MAEKTANAFAERGSQLVGVSLCLDAYFWHVERLVLGFKISLICCVTLSLLAKAGTDYKRHNLSLALEQLCHILGVKVILIATASRSTPFERKVK
jgi:uncharacterized protein YybS (DUF2232 family)